MTSTRELFEMASMYVLNLLDDEERQDFERAYEQAPPAVQAQIRREMLRHSDIEGILPAVSPPPGLKRKVLDAVAAIRDAEARQRVVKRVGPFTAALQRSVSPLWRAACIALLAGTFVLGFSVYRVSDQFRSIQSAESEAGVLGSALQAYGARFLDTIISPNATLVAFTPVEGAQRNGLSASLLKDDAASYVMHRGLSPIDGGYRLVVLHDNDVIGETLASIDATGGRYHSTPVVADIPAGTRLAIIPSTARSAAEALLVCIVV